MKILIVEDERKLADVLKHMLQENKYIVDAVYNGNDGLSYAMADTYDLLILDVMLPGINGFEIVRRIRGAKNSTPVLMLTAKGEVKDRVHGLDCGADDYMQKPFSSDELLARIRALTRRRGELVLDILEYGDLSLRVDNHALSCKDKSVHLSVKEYEVLELLMIHKKQVLTKDTIITRVWGYDSDAENNNLEAYISFLRKKFTYLESEVMIDVVRKVGYTLAFQAVE
jgi:DNA-binding response OmpR family regulator